MCNTIVLVLPFFYLRKYKIIVPWEKNNSSRSGHNHLFKIIC